MWEIINKIRKKLNRGAEKDIRALDERSAAKYLIKKYGTNREYTTRFLRHMLSKHGNNPQFDLYMESELGSLKRSRAFIKFLSREFNNDNLFAGKKCLDIGASSGNSLIAFVENGAVQAAGIELCEGRFQTASVNIGGCSSAVRRKIKMFREDIQNEEVARLGCFDIIFCNDVLEHVENPLSAVRQICRLLSSNPEAFAYVNLRNYSHPQNILHEPHYDLPGMVLLPHDRAQEYYMACNKDNLLKYEVYHWMSFYDYERLFNSFGKACRFHGALKPDISGVDYIENEAEKIPQAFNEFSERINLGPCYKKEIEEYIMAYLSRMRHLADEIRGTKDRSLLEIFYLTYVIFDIAMIVTSEN